MIEIITTALAIAWPIAVWAGRYDDSALRLLVRERRLLTWHLETFAIGAVSAAIVIASGGGHLQWLAWAGGMWGHGSRSVGRRLYEEQARAATAGDPAVHCWRAQRHYSYRGSAAFAGVNLLLGWYGALASIALGVAYDQWRELYTRRRRKRMTAQEAHAAIDAIEARLVSMLRKSDEPVDDAAAAVATTGAPLAKMERALAARLLVGYDLGLSPAEAQRSIHIVDGEIEMGAAGLSRIGAARVPAASTRAKPCTCTGGSCRAAAGLGYGWICARRAGGAR